MILLPMLLVVCILFSGFAQKDTAQNGTETSKPEYTEFSDLSGKTVSMLTGAPFEDLVRSLVPDVGEFTFFNNTPDMLLALKAGKTDAVLINNAIAALAVNRDDDLALFPKNLQDGVFGIAFAKGDPDRDKWQAAYDKISEAEKQELWNKWTGSDESVKILPKQDWPGSNGTVTAAVCDTLEPMSYAGEGGELKGFDVEMILRMAKELDVHVEFTGMEFSAVLASIQAGKAKIGAGSIIVTPERRQGVDFVDYYPAAFVLIVRSVQENSVAQGAISNLSDLEGKRIGVTTGSIQGQQVTEQIPNAQLSYFNNDVDMLTAMRAGQIDAFASAEPLVRYMMTQNTDLTCLDEHLGEGMHVAAIFPKTEQGQALCDEFSAFVREIKSNGVYEEIKNTWYGEDEDKRVVRDPDSLPAKRGTLRMAADPGLVPFVYLKDGKPVGIDIDTVVRFCEEYGYGLEVVTMDFSGIIASVVTGKVDFSCSGIAYTEERAQSVLFSEPTFDTASVIAVLKQDGTAAGGGFFEALAESFEKTFIREDRWQLFLSGIVTTLLITVLSILFGTVLGFFVFMLCRNGNPVANAITRFCVWLVHGMPVVVLLMILYYIVFSSVAIPGAAVSIVGFTLVFAAGVYGMIKAGVGAVDIGQLEAAYTLGYTNRRAFFRVILPQALPHFMPAYKGSITELIKATAVVGYVAVQDLTKVGDLIRSRTYDAFFPLIAVAVIYFALAAVLTLIVNRIEIRIDPRKRKRKGILKGVREHD